MEPRTRRRPASRTISNRERGVALVVVTFVVLVVLVGGLAGIAMTTGELAGARASRTRAAMAACADAAVDRLKAELPNIPTFDETESTLSMPGGQTLTLRAGHVGGDGVVTIVELDQSYFDSSSIYQGVNITNSMGTVGTGNLLEGMHVLSLTATCEGGVYGTREVQLLVRFGTGT